MSMWYFLLSAFATVLSLQSWNLMTFKPLPLSRGRIKTYEIISLAPPACAIPRCFEIYVESVLDQNDLIPSVHTPAALKLSFYHRYSAIIMNRYIHEGAGLVDAYFALGARVRYGQSKTLLSVYWSWLYAWALASCAVSVKTQWRNNIDESF